jgi:type I restriction enzyme S subunit
MDAFAGAIGVSDSDGKSTPVYSVCTPRKENNVNPYYYAYFLRDLAKSGFIESLAKGIRERSSDFRFNDFGILELSVPPLHEQTAIADFLDRKTAQIATAIAQKEKQIELLKEHKQILIHRAVTRGLDPNVKMKDSGVEWIGEIPAHWEVKKLKNCCKMIVCNYVDVYKNDFITNENNFMQATATKQEIEKYKIKINDVLITKDSEDWRDIGVPALVATEADTLLCGYHLAILRPLDIISGAFLSRAFLSPYIQTQLSIKANGVTRYGISHGAILSTFIAVPPRNEQAQISELIEATSQNVNSAVSKQQQGIERLKEYKSVLINAAVTGKIKVN